MIRDYENDRKEDKIFFVLTGFNWKRGEKKGKEKKRYMVGWFRNRKQKWKYVQGINSETHMEIKSSSFDFSQHWWNSMDFAGETISGASTAVFTGPLWLLT